MSAHAARISRPGDSPPLTATLARYATDSWLAITIAVAIGAGSTLAAEGYARADGLWPSGDLVALKAPVFSMAKLLDVDTYLGPEMKSTGEVIGIDRTFAPALWKSLVAAGLAPMPSGKAGSIAARCTASPMA